MLVRFNLAKNRRDSPVLINHERAAFSSFVLFAIHVLVDPDLIGINDLVFWIRQKRERELIFADESSVTISLIHANTEDLRRLFQIVPVVAQLTGLSSASRRIVFGIEIKNQRGSWKICQ